MTFADPLVIVNTLLVFVTCAAVSVPILLAFISSSTILVYASSAVILPAGAVPAVAAVAVILSPFARVLPPRLTVRPTFAKLIVVPVASFQLVPSYV